MPIGIHIRSPVHPAIRVPNGWRAARLGWWRHHVEEEIPWWQRPDPSRIAMHGVGPNRADEQPQTGRVINLQRPVRIEGLDACRHAPAPLLIGGRAYPTKANHWLSYLRRVFGWAREHDHVTNNPAAGIKKVREKRDHRMPELDVFRRVQDYARRCSERGAREKGALPTYLWAAMELAYQARLRGIEVRTLTDHHVEGEVLQTSRRKGSRDNLVRKGEQTEAAIKVLQDRRAAIWAKRGITHLNAPLSPKMRPLFVSEDGEMLTAHGWHTTWGRFMRNAVRDGVISEGERFALHGLKHRGVTDTKGNKKEASGHVTDAMLHVYDHSLPVVGESGGGSP